MNDPTGVSTLATPPTEIRRLVYLGTPDVAVAPLLALHAAGFDIPLVVTRPDKRRGRGADRQPSPVKAAALELGIPVTTDVDDVLDVDADLGVVVAYGRLITVPVLERVPMVNLHFSLLPRWRGAAPVERALLAGDTETGVCVMALAEGLDTGDLYRCASIPIAADATLDSLRGELVELGTTLLVEALREGLGPARPQVGTPTHAAKIERDEYRIDPSRPAVDLDRLIRLGGAWAEFRGKRLKIWEASPTERTGLAPGAFDRSERSRVLLGTATTALSLTLVQPEGKPRLDAVDWANGAQPGTDERLG